MRARSIKSFLALEVILLIFALPVSGEPSTGTCTHTRHLGSDPSKPRYVIRDMPFRAKMDGSTQWFVAAIPESFDKSRSYHLMIALHGGGGDRWQFVNEDFKEARAIRDVASKHEMIYVCPECRGKSCTWMGPAAEADLTQIIKMLHRRYSISKVFVTGQSSGATSALTFAAMHPELVDGVAVLNGIANFFEYQLYQEPISKSFGGSKAQVPLQYKKRSAEYWPERLTMPVAFTTSGRDEAMPPQSVTRLANILQQMARPVLLIHQPDMGHSTSYEDSITALEYVVSGAFKKTQVP